KIWDSTNGKELVSFRGREERVHDLCFNPDGTRIASVGAGGTLRIWETNSGKELLALNAPGASAVCFSPNGTRLAVASYNRPPTVWETQPTSHAIQRNREIIVYVHRLFSKFLLRQEVVAWLRGASKLSEEELASAIQLAQAYTEATPMQC